MKIIVFGGSGFLGSYVADVLAERGNKVVIFDLRKSPYLKNEQVSIVGDITDFDLVNKAVKGCDVIYNYAGIADIDKAKVMPFETIRNNVIGNTNLLEAARINKIKRFIFASTLYVYGKSGSFYRSSKQACELIIESYKEIYGLDFTILRYGSLYGPRANENNWIYKIIKQAMTEKKITRDGDGEEIRDYIHVYDAARLSVDILKEEFKNQHIIITGSQQIKIKDLLVMIREILGNNVKICYKPVASSEHYEITPYTFDPKLARRIQGNTYVDLGQGLLELMKEIHKEKVHKYKVKKI